VPGIYPTRIDICQQDNEVCHTDVTLGLLDSSGVDLDETDRGGVVGSMPLHPRNHFPSLRGQLSLLSADASDIALQGLCDSRIRQPALHSRSSEGRFMMIQKRNGRARNGRAVAKQ
jgi:hypothetical protein